MTSGEVSEMTARSPREQWLYEARLKLARDQQSRLDAAYAEGYAQGFAEGYVQGFVQGLAEALEESRTKAPIVGRIPLLESLLGQATSSTHSLYAWTVEDLRALESDLKRRFRDRKSN